MAEFSFQVGGTAFHLEGSDDVIAYLKFLYRAFPSPSKPRQSWWIAWSEKSCSWRAGDRPAEFILAPDSRHHKPITTSLISRLLIESNPQTLILHGNALLNPTSGKLLLLVGESGAGKTTLTQLLSGHDTGWVPFAEDVLLLHADSAELQPFPRAPAFREWEDAGNGLRHGEKQLMPAKAEYGTPRTLSSASIVLLKHSQSEYAPLLEEAQPDIVWVTSCNDDLLDALRLSGLPLLSADEADGLYCLEYERPLTKEERDRQSDLLRRGNSMIMRTMSRKAEHWRDAQRPVWPSLRQLTASEGISACLSHLVRPSAQFAAQPAGRLFLRLSKALNGGKFYILVPGGTPELTVQKLTEALDS